MFGSKKVDEAEGNKRNKGTNAWTDTATKTEREKGIKRVVKVEKEKRQAWRHTVKNREKINRSTKRLNLNDT